MLKSSAIVNLYRSYLRAIRQLPHSYLRQFYRLKARDDMESLRNTDYPNLQDKKYERIVKELSRMNRGLQGDWRCFDHILDLAYGRKGKLKHELLEPFLADVNAQVPPLIIPQMPSSRPPVYSPELRALLTSDASRTTKALKPSDLNKPSTQRAPQADPSSAEAQLFGGLSKRREKNLLQRFFKQEVQKVYPPLEVDIQSGQTPQEAGIKGGAVQGLNLQQDIEAIVGPVWRPPQLTRRERRAQGVADTTVLPSPPHDQRPTRWLRRRYQSLLTRLPVLTFTPGPKANAGHYAIERSTWALGDVYSTRGRLLPVVAAVQLAWLESTTDQSRAQGRK